MVAEPLTSQNRTLFGLALYRVGTEEKENNVSRSSAEGTL
jgi:hypothetical protein